jgi:acyl carrier protein
MNGRADSIEGFTISTIAELVRCRADDVVRHGLLVDLGVDSLAISTLATFVEAEYGCAFTPAQLTTLYSATRVDEVLLAVRQATGRAADRAVSTTPRAEQAF